MKAAELSARLARLPAGTVVDGSMDGTVFFELPPLDCACTPVPWGSDLEEALAKAEDCLTPCPDECDNAQGEPCDYCGHICNAKGTRDE